MKETYGQVLNKMKSAFASLAGGKNISKMSKYYKFSLKMSK